MLLVNEAATVIIKMLLAKNSFVVRGEIYNDKNIFNPLPRH
jgi:hypothetical protein